MTGSSRGDQSHSESVQSRLGKSLLRLHQGIDQTRKDEARVESMYFGWQKKWSNRREKIQQQLDMIEKKLEQLIPDQQQEPSAPQLVVVGTQNDSDEITDC